MQYSDYKRLKVWQKAMDLTAEIYRLVSAEGHGRQSDKEMVKFLLMPEVRYMKLKHNYKSVSERVSYMKIPLSVQSA